MNQCKACGVELQGAFCHDCGQKVISQRFTFKKILSEAFTIIFNLEKGFFFTIKELAFNPKTVVEGYLNGQTKKYYNPIALVLILGSGVILLSSNLGIYDDIGERVLDINRMMGQDEESIQKSKTMMPYISQFQNIITLIMIPFIAVFTYLFYKSSGLYFAEHNIIICFGAALNMFSALFFTYIYYIFPDHIGTTMSIGMFVNFLIMAYVFKSYFEDSWLISFIYAALSWILGYFLTILFAIIVVSIGAFIVLFFKKTILGS